MRRCLALAVLVVACTNASTTITSLAAPEIRGRSFQRVLIMFPATDLAIRREVETAFVSGEDSTKFVPSLVVLFPGRSYTNEEMTRALDESRIDAVLFLWVSNAGVSTNRVNEGATARCTAYTNNTCSSAVARSTGFDVSKPWADFHAQLYERASGSSVWTASMRSGGNAFADVHDILASMARRTRDQLHKDGVVAPVGH